MATYGGYNLQDCYEQDFAITLVYMDYIVEDNKAQNEAYKGK